MSNILHSALSIALGLHSTWQHSRSQQGQNRCAYMHGQTYLHNNVTALQDPPQLSPDFQVLLKWSQHQTLIILQPVFHT